MLNGTVRFEASIRGHGLQFPLCEVSSKDTGIHKIEIECSGHKLGSTVFVTSLQTERDAVALATTTITKLLNRLSHLHSIAFEDPRLTDSQFTPTVPQSADCIQISVGDYLYLDESLDIIMGIQADTVKTDLERPHMPGEQFFALFRAAMLSNGPVEQFMHLYNLLLMFNNDQQRDVETFIRKEDPKVPETPSPKFKGVMETIYTRLRNEFGHTRPGVNIEVTKQGMAERLGGLVTLTRRVIELQP